MLQQVAASYLEACWRPCETIVDPITLPDPLPPWQRDLLKRLAWVTFLASLDVLAACDEADKEEAA